MTEESAAIRAGRVESLLMHPPRFLRRAGSILAAGLVGVAAVNAEEVAVRGGGTLDVQFTSPPSAETRRVAAGWISNAARAVTAYYGDFPPRRAELRITPREGRSVSNGRAFGGDGPLVTIALGQAATSADVADDWVLTHEMIHLCFPSVDERHHWIEEGLATYVESIARARSGNLSPERAWADLVNGLPQGLPEAGDRGLDFTPTWGRTYWGGALFFLRVDVETRRRTGNRRGLEHALRAIAAEGGTIGHWWKIDRVLAVGDAATGVPVMREIYDEMKATPVMVDLPALWRELGIVRRGQRVSFDDSAPLAAIRRAMTTP